MGENAKKEAILHEERKKNEQILERLYLNAERPGGSREASQGKASFCHHEP